MNISSITPKIRSGELWLGRKHYALSLAHGVLQAQYCGYKQLIAIEFGVFHGAGLLDLCKAAEYFSENSGIEIKVYGFDTGTGLPPQLNGHIDHPEIWQQGNFAMYDPNDLKEKLPPFAELILGNISETLPVFIDTFKNSNSNLGFVSLDVDLYSSSVPCLKIFETSAERLLPAVPMYVDDVNWLITYNKWCGEALAIEEFNKRNEFRKIDEKQNFKIENFHVCHVLDHPARTGEMRVGRMEIYAKPKGMVHDADYFTI
jgi:hypothetical protein